MNSLEVTKIFFVELFFIYSKIFSMTDSQNMYNIYYKVSRKQANNYTTLTGIP